jgi:ketosteroid isomerase-like protein
MIVADKWAGFWIDAMNRRDLDAILTLYAEDVEIRSPFAKLLATSGVVKGKEELRKYWTEATRRMPHVQIELVAVYNGHMALSLHHRDGNGRNTIETMLFDDQEKVVVQTACLDRVR